MDDFFSFDRMITPTIIKIVFWIGLAVSVLSGLLLILSGLAADGAGGLVILGLIYLVLGPVLVRVWCELILVFFRMNDALQAIHANTAPAGGLAAPPPPPPPPPLPPPAPASPTT